MANDKVKSLPVPGSYWERFLYFMWYVVIGILWFPALLFWQDNFHSMKCIDFKSFNDVKKYFNFFLTFYLNFNRQKFAFHNFIRNEPCFYFFEPASQKRTGQVVVLTGGTRGIGREVLKILLQLDYHVIFGARNVDAGLEAVKNIRQQGVNTGHARCFKLDLKSLKSVKMFAENVLDNVDQIDLLINNAGVLSESYDLTEDGYEVQFQTNYLGHFMLTQILLPKMRITAAKKTTNCRVINVTSSAHLFSFSGSIEHVTNPKIYAPIGAYADSKLCQVLLTKYQNAQLKSEDAKVAMYAVHPGMVITDIWVDVPLFNLVIKWLKYICRSVQTAAEIVVYAAMSPDLEGAGGQYIVNHSIHNPSKVADDISLQNKLWDLSQSCINKRWKEQS